MNILNNPADWINLSLVPGLGVVGVWRLIAHFKSPRAVFSATETELQRVAGLRPQQIRGVLATRNSTERDCRELQRLKAVGGHAICYDDEFYPGQLKHLPDPPPVLYCLGDPTILSKNAVAIVGSRAATAYGRRTAFRLAEGLVDYDFTVVSGLALGIDTESHFGALQGGGSTVAVLGCGIDIVYPKQNMSLYKRIAEEGVLISEYPLGTRPDGFRFPARNRIIAGLSEGVVVVEAAKKSGSLITAQIALDVGREVFAVPGQIDSFKSEGAHWLLQQGAKLVQHVDDVVVELGHQGLGRHPGSEQKNNKSDFEIDPDASALLQLIEPYPVQRDALIEKSGETAARVSELLLFLELEGLIEMVPGDQVRRI